MTKEVRDNHYQLWSLIGTKNDTLVSTQRYKFIEAKNLSWPSRIFDVKDTNLNLLKIKKGIQSKELPNSIAMVDNKKLEKQMIHSGLKLKSAVKGMHLDLKKKKKPKNNFDGIEIVDSETKAMEFAKIASTAFGYEVSSEVVASIINNSPQVKIYIGKHNGEYKSSGILFLDMAGNSGLHMIGTVPSARGTGLGGIMTSKLLYEAYENNSRRAVLGASSLGERIYSKLGFVVNGELKSYFL